MTPQTEQARADVLSRAPGEIPPAAATRSIALGASAVGALAVGAVAFGALAIGRLAVGALALRRGRVKKLFVEELTVGRLHIRELVVDHPEPGAEYRSTLNPNPLPAARVDGA
jgi:hypothetical protein